MTRPIHATAIRSAMRVDVLNGTETAAAIARMVIHHCKNLRADFSMFAPIWLELSSGLRIAVDEATEAQVAETLAGLTGPSVLRGMTSPAPAPGRDEMLSARGLKTEIRVAGRLVDMTWASPAQVASTVEQLRALTSRSRRATRRCRLCSCPGDCWARSRSEGALRQASEPLDCRPASAETSREGSAPTACLRPLRRCSRFVWSLFRRGYPVAQELQPFESSVAVSTTATVGEVGGAVTAPPTDGAA